MTFDEWLQHGHKQGWCSPPVCETHSGPPTTKSEDQQLEEGSDPCIYIVRIYESIHIAEEAAANQPSAL